jgi:predicted acetyltransferase
MSVQFKVNIDSGSLPTSEYTLFDGKEEVGFVQIRHKPSVSFPLPQDMASHIYYEIKVSERGKGYGNIILNLTKIEAQKIGLKEILLSVWESNFPSVKSIVKNGGSLLRTYYSEDRKENFFLYVIKLG